MEGEASFLVRSRTWLMSEFQKPRRSPAGAVVGAIRPDTKVDVDVIYKSNRRLKSKESWRELFYYGPFTVLFMVYLLTWRNLSDAFYVTNSALTLVADQEFLDSDGHHIRFRDIDTRLDWFSWADQVLLQSLYQDTWYNGAPRRGSEKRLLASTGELLGALRFRQWRVTSRSCTHYLNESHPCYARYSSTAEDVAPFGPGGTYQHSSDCAAFGGATSILGWDGLYPCPSYVQQIPFSETGQAAADRLKSLKDGLWLDHHTRAVVVEFIVYNPPTDLYGSNKFIVEFLPTGSTITTVTCRTFKVELYQSSRGGDWVLIVLQFAFVVATVGHMGKFGRDWYRFTSIVQLRRRWLTFLLGWAGVECITYLSVTTMLLLRLIWFFDPGRKSVATNGIPSTSALYPPLDRCELLWASERYLCAVSALFVFLKFLKFVKFNPRLNLLTRTLGRAGWSLASLVLIGSVAFTALSLMGYIAYSDILWGFKSWDSTASSLLRILLGDPSVYESMRDASRFFSPVFFALYTGLEYFVILNMIMAVIVDAFQRESSEMRGAHSLGAQLKKKMMRMMGKEDMSNDAPIQTVEDAIIHLIDLRDRLDTVELTLDDVARIFGLDERAAICLFGHLDIQQTGVVDVLELEALYDEGTLPDSLLGIHPFDTLDTRASVVEMHNVFPPPRGAPSPPPPPPPHGPDESAWRAIPAEPPRTLNTRGNRLSLPSNPQFNLNLNGSRESASEEDWGRRPFSAVVQALHDQLDIYQTTLESQQRIQSQQMDDVAAVQTTVEEMAEDVQAVSASVQSLHGLLRHMCTLMEASTPGLRTVATLPPGVRPGGRPTLPL